jgi:hypothetical protein
MWYLKRERGEKENTCREREGERESEGGIERDRKIERDRERE